MRSVLKAGLGKQLAAGIRRATVNNGAAPGRHGPARRDDVKVDAGAQPATGVVRGTVVEATPEAAAPGAPSPVATAITSIQQARPGPGVVVRHEDRGAVRLATARI